MKFFFLILYTIGINTIQAQCDKTIQFNCTKMASIVNGMPGKEVNCNTTIEIRNGMIYLKNNYNGLQTGENFTITKTSLCNWSGYPLNGTTTYIANSNESHENTVLKSKIVIKGINGKIKIGFTLDTRQNTTIQYWADSYTLEK